MTQQAGQCCLSSHILDCICCYYYGSVQMLTIGPCEEKPLENIVPIIARVAQQKSNALKYRDIRESISYEYYCNVAA